MLSTMPHRGPDARGIWSDPSGRCVLGHLRLSIIDTSDAGRQPMATGDGRWLISFNGELYNFQELRPALAAAGISLRGRTDTEVLIESIALWGAGALPKFDGMFAFAAFDTLSGELFLARDPFGEKPLYYMQTKDRGFAFASELQALEGVPGFDGAVSVDAMAELLTFQYIGAPRSIYQNVKKLPAAHWLRVAPDGQITTGRYYEFRPGSAPSYDRPIGELADELEEILTKSLRRRLIADVPLGAFLSGGVDSSTVCALICRKLNLPVKTFSIGFDGAPESEHLIARSFARHLGTEHHEEILSPNASEFLFAIGALLDEPNADSSCLPTYLLSRFARQKVTVAVSGDGGDEMFGGYGRYFSTLSERDQRRAGGIPDWRAGDTYFGSRILVANDNSIDELFGFIPRGFAEHLSLLRGELNDAEDSLLAAMRRSDVENYMPGAVLPKVDRMSMRHSLEVRTPFLNTELARFAERLPDSAMVREGRGKVILREVAYRHLPRELIDLPKQGFGMPMSDWGRANLLDIVSQLLESDDSRLRAAFGEDGVNRFLARQRTPGQFAAYQVWGVAALESWLRHHPAVLPTISEKSKTQQRSYQLHAVPLGDTFYAVTRQRAARPIEETAAAPLWSVPLEVTFRVIDLPENQSGAAGTHEPAPVRLPDWGSALEDAKEGAGLRGAILFLADDDAAAHLDYHELQKFTKLGVRSVIFRGTYIGGELVEIRLKDLSPRERRRAFMKLFPRRVAMIADGVGARLLGARPSSVEPDGRQHSGLLKTVDPIPERDLCYTYMAFEGMRQLPPVHVSHVDIVTKGNGRYSVFEQVLFYSHTEKQRSNKPVWLVRRTPETIPWLEMAPYRQLEEGIKGASVFGAFANLLEQAEAKPCVLRPGDTVVVCTHGLPPGGAERQWVYLAQGLKDAGYRVVFVICDSLHGENAHYLPMLKESQIELVDASKTPLSEQIRIGRTMPHMFEKLRSGAVPHRTLLMNLTCALASIKPKVVYTQLDQWNVLAGLAAHLADVPRVVLSFRNYNPTHLPYLYKDWYLPAYQMLCKSGRVILSGNHRGANDDYADWIGVSRERVMYVPNAIEPHTFPTPDDAQLEMLRAELGVTANTPVILGAFRLSHEKAPFNFIEVCARVSVRVPDARMFIAGVGTLRGEVEEKIAELGLKDHIKLLGRRSDVNVLMRLANVFLLTSDIEGMPNVLLEAQLVGTPVVSTRAGGVPDVVVDGETGIICDIGDVEALSNACTDLLRVPARARRMGAAARMHVLSVFSKRRMVQGYLDMVGEEEREANAPQAITLAG